jgi:transposase
MSKAKRGRTKRYKRAMRLYKKYARKATAFENRCRRRGGKWRKKAKKQYAKVLKYGRSF